MDEPSEAAIGEEEPRLPCSLCERECFHQHTTVVLIVGNTTVQVACHECALRFRHLVKLSLAAARQLRRRERELEALEERQFEGEETRG